MLCQKCHQRQATVFFSQTIGNQTTQSHLCDVCAQEQMGVNPLGINPFAAFADLLNNFVDWGAAPNMEEVKAGRVGQVSPGPQMQCPHCGYQLATFRQNGRLGCTQCYDSFKAALEPLITGIHGSARHQDEPAEPKTVVFSQSAAEKPEGSETNVKALRRKLKTAIQNERFEEAAQLRDEIKRLEGGKNGV